MEKKKLTIDDLLEALKTPEERKNNTFTLSNSEEVWSRIGRRDETLATDLGVDEEELDKVINEWIKENPYHAIED